MKTRRQALAACAVIALAISVSALSDARPDAGKYDIGKSEVVDSVILSVIENYYDISRIDPPAMFKASMDALQKIVAEIKLSYEKKDAKAVIDMMGEKLSLDLSEIDSPWALSKAMKKAFAFIGGRLPSGEYDQQELEYMAANAMLSTLDPHSNALPPDIYEDLRMETEGAFGGLGIKITTDRRPPCLGNLTVVEVFDGTPAKRAGLIVGDEILKIDGESTVNITTEEAAQRLRGEPGTSVRVVVRRAGEGVKSFHIMREVIQIKSVKWRMEKGKVGYIFLEAFQGNTVVEFKKALADLHDAGMKGLILDLRANPGGLLDAAVDVADNFIDSGTIVAIAGRNAEDREVRNATMDGTEPSYPMVILVDSTSASAAEIMAGALRNHGRALLIGETTFGKGSVQRVDPIPGGGALKLTSARYLVPGDISIQAVGVAPDITFVPVTVDRKELDLDPTKKRFSEADLEHHLDRPSTRSRSDRPGAIDAHLFFPAAERKSDDQEFERCYVEDQDWSSFVDRYEEEFARRLISSSSGVTAEELLVQARSMIESDSKEQDKAEIGALKKLGVDWSLAPKGAGAAAPDKRVAASVRMPERAVPGKPFNINVTVANKTDETIYRLRAVTKSDNVLLDDYELAFGKMNPGESKNWTLSIDLPETAIARIDPVTIEFKSDQGPVPEQATEYVEMSEIAEPRIAYAWSVEDVGNGNGRVEAGEEVLLHLKVENVGAGSTVDSEANLSAKPGVDILEGRFEIGRLKPGDRAEGGFRLKMSDKLGNRAAKIELSIEDWIKDRFPRARTLLHREIEIPISPEAAASKPVGEQSSDKTEPKLISPPIISIDGLSVMRVKADKARIEGWAEHPEKLQDLIVFVGNKKLLYQQNKGSSSNRMKFALDVPLENGANQVVIIARHSHDVVETKGVFIRRDPL